MGRFNSKTIIALLVGVLLLTLSYTVFEESHLTHAATHELGFALLVAVLIWTIYEFFNAADAERQWTHRVEVIAKNVFLGVYRKDFPSAIIQEANSLILDQQFVRSDMHLNYIIEDKSFVDRFGSKKDFVLLSAVTRCKTKNIGNSAAKLNIAIGLPNPMIDEIKEFCKVKSIVLRKGNGSEEIVDLTQFEQKFRSDIADDEKYQVVFSIGTRDLQPNESIEMVFDYQMAKEEEDTEIFQTLYPANGISLAIMDKNPEKRLVRARSIHASPLENNTSATSSGSYHYRIGRFVLPHQGYAIWWKKKPIAGDTTSPVPLVKVAKKKAKSRIKNS